MNLTASIGDVSAQAQVNVLGGTSLPVGSIVWSAPQVPGFTALQIVQAVPTATGPGLFEIDQDLNLNVLVRGLTGDGQQLWQSSIPATQGQFINQFTPMMGDGFGGLLLIVPVVGTIDIDGQSGTIAWQNTSIGPTASVGQDGSVLTTDSNGNFAKVNPQSGQSVPAYPPPVSSFSSTAASACILNTPVISGTTTGTEPGNILGPSVVDAQGNAFFTVSATTFTQIPTCINGEEFGQITDTTQYWVVEVAPNGTATKTLLAISLPLPPGDQLSLPNVLAPDGNGGALVQWATTNSGAVIMDTSTGTTNPSPLANGVTQVVRSQNGGAFYTDGNSVAHTASLSGPSDWTYQPLQGNVNSMIATLGGSVTIVNGGLNQIPLDPSGTAGTLVSGVNSTNPFALGQWASTSQGQASMVSGPQIILDGSSWPVSGGNLTGSRASPKLTAATFIPSPIAQSPNDPRFGSDANVLADLKKNIPASLANNTVYTKTVGRTATIPNFVKENAPAQLDVVAFDGHGLLIFGGAGNISAGMIFDDNTLIRTPDCPPPGTCYPVPPSDETWPVILTSAKVVFVAQCDVGPWFTGWWDMDFNTDPQGRALVVPNIAMMAQLNNDPTINPGDVDLEQGAIGWEALVQSLAAGNTVQTAVNAANSAIATYYATSSKSLAQVVLMVYGNPNVCPRCQ
ncbi:MAG: hypothetical protein WAJ96_14595 [Candidatus Acidiferrum sp.]